MSKIVELLTETFGKDTVRSRTEAGMRVASNWRQDESLDCLALLLPQSTAEVSKMLQLCHEYNQPVVYPL